MKILRIYTGKLWLLSAMLLFNSWLSAQCIDDTNCEDAIYIGNQNTPGTTVPSDTYSSENILHSDGTINDTSIVDYKSNYVRLDIGFSTEVGADFSAEIEACVETDTGQGGENPELDCPETLYVGNDNTPESTIAPNLYQANTSLESDGTVAVSDIVRQKAGHHVTLKPGFKALTGSIFRGYIEDCSGATEATYYVNDASQIGDIYTTAPGSDITGNGTAARPFASLKHVIQNKVLTGGDIIYIDTGIYDDTFIEINNPISNLTIRGAGAYNTIFDNNYTDNNIEADHVSTGNLFMRIYADGISLEGFTVREYNYFDKSELSILEIDGKAISVADAQCIMFEDVHIMQNATTYDASFNIDDGGFYFLSSLFIINSSVDIINSSISYNTSITEEVVGGGIVVLQIENNSINIENTVINGNTGIGPGTGIVVGGGSLNINNSSVSNNQSKYAGGGIYAFSEVNLNINNSCISNNIVANQYESNADGGGIYIGESVNLNLYNTVFDSNIAGGAHPSQGRGGAIYKGYHTGNANESTIKIDRCKFDNNQAAQGNHIYVSECRLDVNEAQFLAEADAIFNLTDATLYIQNSGTPETSSTINFINNNPPQNYATPSCANTVDCIADAGFDQVICTGESVQIGAEPENDLAYTWDPITGLSNPNIANPTASPFETTTYTLYITGCGRGSQDEITVYVSDGDITFPANQVTCSGANVPLVIHGGAEYEWNPAEGLSCANCPNPIANVTETTTYTATVTDENGCEITGSVTITIAGTLAVTVESDDQDGIICPGQTVQLTAAGAMDYTWSATSGGFSNSNIYNPMVTPTETTTYTVVGFQDECMSQNQITLTLAPEYEVNFTAIPNVCAISLTADNNSLNDYQWSVDGTVVEEAAGMHAYSHGISHNGTYNICLTVTGICGEEVTTCQNVYVDNCICLDADIFDCPQYSVNIGHPCDDNNANTYGDMYMDDCVCRGVDCSLVELAVNDELPSAIYYDRLVYDGIPVTDYLIEWVDVNDNNNVVFTSAHGIYSNQAYESHPPASDDGIPIPAGTYRPVVIQSSLPGILECTLPSSTINKYTCEGLVQKRYEGPPGVVRQYEIDWAGNSNCNLYLRFDDRTLPDNLEVIGVDANGVETSLYARTNFFEHVLTIQGNYESVMIRITSDPAVGENTEWYLTFGCCYTDPCTNCENYNVDYSITTSGGCTQNDCRIALKADNGIDGCYLSNKYVLSNRQYCHYTNVKSNTNCRDTKPFDMTINGGVVLINNLDSDDYIYLRDILQYMRSNADYTRINFYNRPCGNDGDNEYISFCNYNDYVFDDSDFEIQVTYTSREYDDCDFANCDDCAYYNNRIVNGYEDGVYTIKSIKSYYTRDNDVVTSVSVGGVNDAQIQSDNYFIHTYSNEVICGDDGQLPVYLKVNDLNSPCTSWELWADTNGDGTYSTCLRQASGACPP